MGLVPVASRCPADRFGVFVIVHGRWTGMTGAIERIRRDLPTTLVIVRPVDGEHWLGLLANMARAVFDPASGELEVPHLDPDGMGLLLAWLASVGCPRTVAAFEPAARELLRGVLGGVHVTRHTRGRWLSLYDLRDACQSGRVDGVSTLVRLSADPRIFAAAPIPSVGEAST